MESPSRTTPPVVDRRALEVQEDEFDDDDDDNIPRTRRKSRSFDYADIDLTYSEDLPTFPTVSVIPRDVPTLPYPIFTLEKGFSVNPAGSSSISRHRPEERQDRNLVYADYDLSDEEDDLLIGEEDSLLEDDEEEPKQNDRSLDTSRDIPTEPQEIGHTCSASFSGLSPVGDSKVTHSEVESLLDPTVPSRIPRVPMRRVASSPIRHSDGKQRGLTTPPLSQSKLQSPSSAKSRGSVLRVSSPYSLRRQPLSMPARTSSSNGGHLRQGPSPGEFTKSPALVFTDDAYKQTIHGESGTPKNASNRGASIFRSGSIGRGLASPTRVVIRTPIKEPRNQRNGSLERSTLLDPYALRRHVSLPSSTRFRGGNDSSAGNPARIEFHTPTQNKSVTAYNPSKPNSALNSTDGLVSLRRSSIGSKAWPDIKESPSGATADVESDYIPSPPPNAKKTNDHLGTSLHTIDVEDLTDAPSDSSIRSNELKIFFQQQMAQCILYLSAFSVFGCTIRVFLVRIFGTNCEVSDPTMDEFCITATGRTLQRGGALFADLPANMVGCFIMGLMTSLQTDLWPPLPWFRPNHPLQQNSAYHEGIRTGLCGSITTFASWNSQMIVMMDGTNTELGSQVVSALFGFVIGFCCAIASYLFGTHVATWISRWRNPELAREVDDEEARLTSSSGRVELDITHNEDNGAVGDANRLPPTNTVVLPAFLGTSETWYNNRICKGHNLPFVLVAILLSGYAVGGFIMQKPFYRTLFYTSLLTPPGALLRWKLSRWNTRFDHRWRRLHWLPVGTFVANVVASLVSVALLALETRYLFDDASSNIASISIITAARAGFAGSLSTASTMVKELFLLNREYPHEAKPYHYALFTVVTCIVLCISVYSPVVRSG